MSMHTTQSKDGTKLAYDVYGSGPPLLYITGATCHRTFKPVIHDAKVFATAFTVYSYDRRGRGDSGNSLPYSIDREIEDVEAMIEAAGGTVYVYGHSSGAVLALEAALRLSSNVSKIVLYDAPYVSNAQDKVEYERLSHSVHKLLDAGNNGDAMLLFLKGIGMPRLFVRLLPLFPGWRKIKALAPTLAYDIALTKDLPPVERASQLSVPTFIVVGEKSPAAIHDVSRQLAGAIPHAERMQLAGQNHMVSPKKMLPLLLDFFELN